MAQDGFTQGRLLSWLRGLAEGSDAPFRRVLAASKSIDWIFKDEGKTSFLQGIGIEVRLEGWDEATARAFITSRLQSTSVTFTDKEVSEIIAKSKKIGRGDEATARAFLASRFPSTSVTLTDEEVSQKVSQIIAESKVHPQQLIELCYQTYSGYVKKSV